MNTKPYSPPRPSESRTPEPPRFSLLEIYTWGVAGCLILCAAILTFADIGFDKPGRYGLDFFHVPVLIGISLIGVVTGLIAAYRIRSARSACLLVAGAFIVVLGVMAS